MNNRRALWNIKCKNKLHSVPRKKDGIILELTGKNSNLERKTPKGNLHYLLDPKRRKKPWTRRVDLKKDMHEKVAKVIMESTE